MHPTGKGAGVGRRKIIHSKVPDSLIQKRNALKSLLKLAFAMPLKKRLKYLSGKGVTARVLKGADIKVSVVAEKAGLSYEQLLELGFSEKELTGIRKQ